MKTLKKTLCLVLAVVMVVGVLILPAYAADDYDDAIKALQNYGVLQGYPDGDLHKDANITRGQMAAIIYRIMTGDTSSTDAEVAVKYGSYADRFTDADVAPWAKGYIGFCYNKGVLKGYDTGAVQPNKQINGYEVQAMLLRALGYDSNGEYTGNNWQYNVLSDATKSGISKNVSLDPAKATPRGAVAQYTFDAATKTDRVAPTLVPNVGYSSIGKKLMSITTAAGEDDWYAPCTVYTVTYTWPDTAVVTTKTVADKALLESYAPVTQAAVYKAAGLTEIAKQLTICTNGNKATTKTTIDGNDATAANAMGGQGRWTRVYKDRVVYVDTFLTEVGTVTSEVKVNGKTAIKASYDTKTYYHNPANVAYTGDLKIEETTTFVKGDMLCTNAFTTTAVLAGEDRIDDIDTATKANSVTVTVDGVVRNDTATEITGLVATNGKTYLYNCTYAYNGGSKTDKVDETAIGKSYVLYLDAKDNILGVKAVETKNEGQGVVIDVDAQRIKGAEYYGELTVLTDKNTQVKVNFIDIATNSLGTTAPDKAPYENETAAITEANKLMGHLIQWKDDKDSAKANYTGYSLITVANNGTPTNTFSIGNTIEAGDADAIDATHVLNDKTVFFIANYGIKNSTGGGNYAFSDYSVVTGFQNIQDLVAGTTTITGNPNKALKGTGLYIEEITSSGCVKYVLVMNATEKKTNTVETVKNYAYIADPTQFVYVYDNYYRYDAAIKGVAHQPLNVNYASTSTINATGLYVYDELTNGSWKDVKLAKTFDNTNNNKIAGDAYSYKDGVLYTTKATTDGITGNQYLTVAKDAQIYLVDPANGDIVKIDVTLDVVQKAYGKAVNNVWFQLNQYGWIDLMYVEIPDVGSTSGVKGLTTVTISGNLNSATVDRGKYVSDYKFSASATSDDGVNDTDYKVKVTATWLVLDGSGNYVPYTGEAFVTGKYRVKYDLSVTNLTSTKFAIASTTGIVGSGAQINGNYTGKTTAYSDVITVA